MKWKLTSFFVITAMIALSSNFSRFKLNCSWGHPVYGYNLTTVAYQLFGVSILLSPF
jgi:hypothetical protein